MSTATISITLDIGDSPAADVITHLIGLDGSTTWNEEDDLEDLIGLALIGRALRDALPPTWGITHLTTELRPPGDVSA